MKISHKKFIKQWKPKCVFCGRRTVLRMPDRKWHVCIRCLRAVQAILELNCDLDMIRAELEGSEV